VASDEHLRLLRYRVVEVLVELAAAPEQQIAYFDRTDNNVDELVEHFSWTQEFTPNVRAAGLLPESTVEPLDAIDRLLAEMSARKDASLWSNNALATLEEWHRIRAFARTALQQLSDLGIPIPSIEDPLRQALDAAPDSEL
jgi:hypothetical protein